MASYIKKLVSIQKRIVIKKDLLNQKSLELKLLTQLISRNKKNQNTGIYQLELPLASGIPIPLADLNFTQIDRRTEISIRNEILSRIFLKFWIFPIKPNINLILMRQNYKLSLSSTEEIRHLDWCEIVLSIL